MNDDIHEYDLHAWLDGQLPAARQAAVEDWLRSHPQEMARITAWRRDAAALRAGFAGRLPDAPQLRVQAVRRRLAERRRARAGIAAGLVAALGLGLLGGWQLHARHDMALAPPMADAVAAYRLFAAEDAPVAFDGGSRTALQAWLRTHFGGAGVIPELTSQGYALAGGRLLSTPEGPAAMLLYRDAAGTPVALYLRPRTPRFTAPGERRDGRLLAQYWVEGGTAFALVGPATAAGLRQLAPLLRGS
ncbi:MAG: anti-sigma factor [Stenotrophomonas sp.]|nr:anti-sigma factor [Xanthomonadales bacterium]MBN8767870.1 anti-sigma factor [Stenotrophomonas sp.]